MPQARDSRIPPAHPTGLNEVRLVPVAPKPVPTRQSASSGPARFPGPQPIGVFPIPWGWQLAGLLAAMVLGAGLLAISALAEADGFTVGHRAILSVCGLAILGLAVHSAARTKWLREARSAPLAVRVGAGTSIVVGLVPIGIGILSAVVGLAAIAIYVWLVFSIIGAVLEGGS